MIEYVLVVVAFIVGFFLGKLIGLLQSKLKEGKIRKSAIKQSQYVIKGQVNEQIAPYLPNFPADPSDVIFVGKPIDFIAFENKKDQMHVTFIEVKTGKSQLSHKQKQLKEAIQKKRIHFKEYRI